MDFIRQHTDCLYMTYAGVPNVREKEVPTQVEHWDEGDQHMTRYTTHVGGHADHGAEP